MPVLSQMTTVPKTERRIQWEDLESRIIAIVVVATFIGVGGTMITLNR